MSLDLLLLLRLLTLTLLHECVYRGTSLIRNNARLGPSSRTMPMALWWFWGRELFLISEVPLYLHAGSAPRNAKHHFAEA